MMNRVKSQMKNNKLNEEYLWIVVKIPSYWCKTSNEIKDIFV